VGIVTVFLYVRVVDLVHLKKMHQIYDADEDAPNLRRGRKEKL
jgi:hypothetical protein